MLGTFFGIGQELGGKRSVLGGCGAAPARAGEWTDGDGALAQPHQHFRARAHDREMTEIEKEEEGRGVKTAERAIKRKGR
jgi:hypothetical protein